MTSPYQLILLNLIHIQGYLLGVVQVLASLRRRSSWQPALLAWRIEQERQLRVLLVLFRHVGGTQGAVHFTMLGLAKWVGRATGLVLALAPVVLIRVVTKTADDTLITGLERAGHQLSLADWSEWAVETAINPPKALSDLCVARREWPAKSEGLVRFL